MAGEIFFMTCWLHRQMQNTGGHLLISFGREKTPVEFYNEVKTAYDDKAISRTSVFKWCHISSHQKFKTTISAKKIVASMFWDCQGLILIEYMPQGETINSTRYCETLKKLWRANQNKRRGMLTNSCQLSFHQSNNLFPHLHSVL